MNKLMEKMENVLAPLATKIGNNKILKAISGGFNMVMAIIIIGAIFSLLNTFQIDAYQNFLTSTGIGTILGLVGTFTTDMMAVYVAFTVAYSYVKNEGLSGDAIPAGLLSILAFFIMTPLTTAVINEIDTTVLTFDYLGSKGLFTALLVGLLVGFLYCFVVNRGWTIKMPEGVPPTVSKSFSALIPGFIITIVFLIINGIFATFTGETFSEWFYALIASPLSALSGSLATYMLITLMASIFWFFGIHGGQVTLPFSMILFMQAGVENQAAYAAGEPMQNILTVGFLFLMMLGGIGNTLGLNIDMLTAKSERYKALGRLAILPSLCSINEPIMFGMPIILNPIMAIPFFLVPQILIVIAYFSMSIGLVSLPRIAMGATGTPVLLDGWLICGISGVVLEIILVAISAIIYYPFFKIQDNIALKEEQKNA
ncbi:MAG: PTS transporter subunit EIIC [Erysipelotrichaceae bacterium]|nr:PTS transporter subunit EIIC [Erysipelotrichaceae bacterium]